MLLPTFTHEQQLWELGYLAIVGLDEVGRGAWAGPVVVGAASCAPDIANMPISPLIRDSKLLSASQRQVVASEIQQSYRCSIGQASVEEINHLGIAAATFLAMERAYQQLQPDFLLIDAFTHPQWPKDHQRAVIKGDALVASIAAASIVAKVFRDNLMVELAAQYPEYQLDQHKGYGTKVHQQAIIKHGLSPIHRKGYKLKILQAETEQTQRSKEGLRIKSQT